MLIEDVDVLVIAILELLKAKSSLFFLKAHLFAASFDGHELLVSDFLDFPALLLFRVDFKQALLVVLIHLCQFLLEFVHIVKHFTGEFLVLPWAALQLQFFDPALHGEHFGLLGSEILFELGNGIIQFEVLLLECCNFPLARLERTLEGLIGLACLLRPGHLKLLAKHIALMRDLLELFLAIVQEGLLLLHSRSDAVGLFLGLLGCDLQLHVLL
jgi:hypothetical protein